MRELYDLMEKYEWDYSKLTEDKMYYNRAIHILASAIKREDKRYPSYLMEQFTLLRQLLPKLSINRQIMIEQAKALAKYDIPLYIKENSGGFQFEGKEVMEGNLNKFSNKNIIWE